jgi:PadR family transcriptional regulator PadR
VGGKHDILRGTLDLMVLQTLDTMGPLHGYSLARRLEQVAGEAVSLNQGTLYPALLRLEQRGWIGSKWGVSQSGRRVRMYALTARGRTQLERERADWSRTVAMMSRLLGEVS